MASFNYLIAALMLVLSAPRGVAADVFVMFTGPDGNGKENGTGTFIWDDQREQWPNVVTAPRGDAAARGFAGAC